MVFGREDYYHEYSFISFCLRQVCGVGVGVVCVIQHISCMMSDECFSWP